VKVAEVAQKIGGRILTAADEAASRDVCGGYASDLLSDVMANSTKGDLWVTMQKHVNTIAVATLNELAAIVLVNGREPEEATIQRAEQERVPVISTGLTAFDVAGILYGFGVRGRRTA
jgi:hypothetical protein